MDTKTLNIKVKTTSIDKASRQTNRQAKAEAKNQIFWQTSINDKRQNLKMLVNNNGFEGMVDTGADITINFPRSWPPDWPLLEIICNFK